MTNYAEVERLVDDGDAGRDGIALITVALDDGSGLIYDLIEEVLVTKERAAAVLIELASLCAAHLSVTATRAGFTPEQFVQTLAKIQQGQP